MNFKKTFLIFISSLFLANCGGGGGGGGDSVVSPSNNPPTINSSSAFSADENQTSIGTVSASDPDGDSLTYSISGSEILISSSGVLTFQSAPDFETKNSYSATVTVSDGSLSVTQDITVSINDLFENTPPSISGNTFNVDENSISISDLTLSDPDGDSLSVIVEPNRGFHDINDNSGPIIGMSDDLDGNETTTLGNSDGSILIISENKTFQNEIVKLISDVQLADDVVLEFNNSGLYSSDKENPYKIEVRNGQFTCMHSRFRGIEVYFKETEENPSNTSGKITISDCSWIKGYLARASGNAVYGEWYISGSYFEEVNKDDYAYFWYPKGIRILSNIFYNSGPFSIGFNSNDIVNGNGSSSIFDNIFVRNDDEYSNAPGNCLNTKVYICLWAAYGSRQLSLGGNAFLNTNVYAHVDVSDGETWNMTSDDNYYGITNTTNVYTRYLDSSDNLSYKDIKLDDVLTYIDTNALRFFQPRLIYKSDGSFELDVAPDYEAKQRIYKYKITFNDGTEEVIEEITINVNDLAD